jgi:hypothetical protein
VRATGRWALVALALALALALAMSACTDDDGGAERSAAALCAAASGSDLTEVFDGFDPTDTERALDQLRDARLRLGELHAVAPDGPRDALSTEIAYVDALIDALEAAPPDDPTAAVAAVNGLDAEQAAANVASGELQAFEDASCGTTTTPSTP